MPCNSDYMEASHDEKFISLVYSLLDELEGRKFNHKEATKGYDGRVYNKVSTIDADALVADLCSKLSAIGDQEIKSKSLELQIWWRDHQEADRKRKIAQEIKRKKEIERLGALKKLTEREKELLRLEIND